ncbi:MAG: helix-turn-helix transcriptional regulator [Clostridia bacterium]|nr:helix-turn-helix transcriptional regulator [Clostridia bacterium]
MEEYDFKDILEDFLIQRGLTQTAFAKAVGVKQSQVSEWLKGKAKPGYDILKRMSTALGVSADYWLGIVNH